MSCGTTGFLFGGIPSGVLEGIGKGDCGVFCKSGPVSRGSLGAPIPGRFGGIPSGPLGDIGKGDRGGVFCKSGPVSRGNLGAPIPGRLYGGIGCPGCSGIFC